MNELRQKRKKLELTQLQAANACGVSLRTYQTYEETTITNETYDFILKRLDEMGILDGSNYIASIKGIKNVCRQLFKNKYPEIRSAYLFGSYARGEADGTSDIDIVLVCPALGMKLYGITTELEERLHKKIDLHTHRQLAKNEKLLEEVLTEGIKIYG